MSTLGARKQLILRLKYGLAGERSHTDEQIAATLGIDPTQVREDELGALRELRASPADLSGAVAEGHQAGQAHELQLSEVVESVRELTPDLIAHLREHDKDLEKISPGIAEHLVAELLASRGFRDVQLLGRDPTTSADVFAAYYVHASGSLIRYFVEVKRWKSRVGIEVINSVYGAMLLEEPERGWHVAMIVSVAGFAAPRKITHERLALRRVELRGRDDIVRWLDEYAPNAGGLWVRKK